MKHVPASQYSRVDLLAIHGLFVFILESFTSQVCPKALLPFHAGGAPLKNADQLVAYRH